jgi:hypothetical protein
VIGTRGMRWVGHVTYMGEMKNEYTVLVAKFERKEAHWRHKNCIFRTR